MAYGDNIEDWGPVYHDMKAEGGKVHVSFAHAAGLKSHGDEVKGFQLAGADGKFAPAKATIEGDHVVVSSDAVAEPTAVRYNWAAFPDGNLYNGADLPEVPFRTDSIKGPGAP